jgi:hypothetical protein
MHEAVGEGIAESSCFVMVTLQFRRVNGTVVWGYAALAAAKRKRDPSTAVGMTTGERKQEMPG